MKSTVKTFNANALKAGRTRTGEPQLYSEAVYAQMEELVASLKPGDLIQIEKTYKDGTSQEARMIVLNDRSVMKSGDLRMEYSVGSQPLNPSDLAIDLSMYRSNIKTVTISVLSERF